MEFTGEKVYADLEKMIEAFVQIDLLPDTLMITFAARKALKELQMLNMKFVDPNLIRIKGYLLRITVSEQVVENGYYYVITPALFVGDVEQNHEEFFVNLNREKVSKELNFNNWVLAMQLFMIGFEDGINQN